jgi:hypothetical protein
MAVVGARSGGHPALPEIDPPPPAFHCQPGTAGGRQAEEQKGWVAMVWVLLFLAGALLCNAIPHLAAGLRGEPFPTPFARPRGVGHSSPTINFLWGTANLAAGVALLLWRLPMVECDIGLAVATAGWLAIGLYLARPFGAVRKG